MNQGYVLGADGMELDRLRRQHQLWSPYRTALWNRAGFTKGQTIFDLGCGPGYTTLDLSALVGANGHVLALDQSRESIRRLEAAQKARSVGKIETRTCDLAERELEEGSIDGAFARWVLCYLQDAEPVVAAVAAALRDGGVFVIQEYFNYLSVKLAPQSQLMDTVARACYDSFNKEGNIDVGLEVPAMMLRNGLKIVDESVVIRVARPGSELWQWPTDFFKSYLPKLVAENVLAAPTLEAFRTVWTQRSGDPSASFSAWPVLQIVGVKRDV